MKSNIIQGILKVDDVEVKGSNGEYRSIGTPHRITLSDWTSMPKYEKDQLKLKYSKVLIVNSIETPIHELYVQDGLIFQLDCTEGVDTVNNTWTDLISGIQCTSASAISIDNQPSGTGGVVFDGSGMTINIPQEIKAKLGLTGTGTCEVLAVVDNLLSESASPILVSWMAPIDSVEPTAFPAIRFNKDLNGFTLLGSSEVLASNHCYGYPNLGILSGSNSGKLSISKARVYGVTSSSLGQVDIPITPELKIADGVACKILSIRVYNRDLTYDEVARNRDIDLTRLPLSGIPYAKPDKLAFLVRSDVAIEGNELDDLSGNNSPNYISGIQGMQDGESFDGLNTGDSVFVINIGGRPVHYEIYANWSTVDSMDLKLKWVNTSGTESTERYAISSGVIESSRETSNQGAIGIPTGHELGTLSFKYDFNSQSNTSKLNGVLTLPTGPGSLLPNTTEDPETGDPVPMPTLINISGKVYAIRAYTESLSDELLRYNATIDKLVMDLDE